MSDDASTVSGAASMKPVDSSLLLQVQNLETVFDTPRGTLRAVAGVSFDLEHDQTIGVVGESGSGKTVLSRTIMGLQPLSRVSVTGSVKFEGQELVGAKENQLRHLWGKEIAMIFQDPMTSLNPVTKIGKQISESLHVRMGMSKKDAKVGAIDLLAQVGIPSPKERYSVYPNQLSGGMRQRVVIAIALACGPKLLMADEPTTGLDVTIQAQILNLLDEMKEQRKMSVMLVTHDLGVVAHRTDRIIVMYAGRVVETARTHDIFFNHRMPYTQALLASTPRVTNASHTRLTVIPGRPPDLLNLPVGCSFAPRCPRATAQCQVERPELVAADSPDHLFACWNPVTADSRAQAIETAKNVGAANA